jgi:uncharacterized protein
MILDTGSIREGHSVVRQASDLASVKDDLPPFSEKVMCEATIDRTGPMVYVQLHFEGSFRQECSRCLETFDFPVTATLPLVLQEHDGKDGPAEEEDTADFYFNTGHQSVDLASVIYDEVMISLPLKPLCSENCTLHLPDESTGQSSRSEESIDPRWEALLKLKKK